MTSLWILGGNSVKTVKAKGEEGESLKKRGRVLDLRKLCVLGEKGKERREEKK